MQLSGNNDLKNQILDIWKNVNSNVTVFDSIKVTIQWAFQNMKEFPRDKREAWYTAALSWEAAQRDPSCPEIKREGAFPCFPMAWLLMMSTSHDPRTKMEPLLEQELESLKAVFKDLNWYEDYWEPFFQDNLELKEEVQEERPRFPIAVDHSKPLS